MTPARRRRRRPRRIVAPRLVVVTLGVIALVLGWEHVTGNIAGASSAGLPVDASGFAAGACMAFPPTAGDRQETVFLDAGHGGIDPGGVGTTESGHTITEAAETLRVELDAMALLRAKGFRVVVSRTTDSTVLRLGPADVYEGTLSLQGAHDDVAARDVCANLAKANVLVGIYFDASGSPQTAGSLTAYDTARPLAAANIKLAGLLQHAVLSAMNARGWEIPNDGVLSDNGLGSSAGNPADGGLAAQSAAYDHLLLLGPAAPGYFSTPSEMPGAVIEPLYISDPFEGSIASSANGQRVIARGIATAVEEFLRSASPSG
jgi:N-acetylmuramoyl-L-alanine amidase